LETTGRINNVLSVYSGVSGYALFEVEDNNMASGMVSGNGPRSSGMGGGMGGSNNPAQTSFVGATPNMQLREGMYVNRDQTLFYVNDFATVWGVLSFDESTQSLLRTGMNVVVKSELLSLPVRSSKDLSA
jgi:Cu(I)/Ag(I) efflux system membrane fusion protein